MIQTLIEQLDSYTSDLKQKRKSKSTISSYRTDILGFLNFCDTYKLRLEDFCENTLKNYQEYLEQILLEKPSSIRRKTIGIKQFFKYLTEQKYVLTSPFEKNPIPMLPKTNQRKLPLTFIKKLLDHASKNKEQLIIYRDQALFSLLAYEGLKVSELIELKWGDFQNTLKNPSLRISCQKYRVIELDTQATKHLNALKNYLISQSLFKTSSLEKEKIFFSYKGSHFMKIMPGISRHGIKFILREYGKFLNKPNLNSEMLRYFAISLMVQKKKSIKEIMAHFGLSHPGALLRM